MSEPIEGDPGSPPDAPEPDSRDARRRFRQDVATGLTWTLIGTWGRQGIDLIVFAVLARLLLPEDFGLVASGHGVRAVCSAAGRPGDG